MITPIVERSGANPAESYQNPAYPPNAETSLRLLADGMLGTLAKWLRLLGYDTLFDPALDDHALVRLARAEGRILLTRDHALAARRGLRIILVVAEDLEAQIAQVVSAFKPSSGPARPGRIASRCAVCNGELALVPKETVAARVPPYIWRTQEEFRECQDCRRVYWRGTHWRRIAAKVAQWEGTTLKADSSEGAR